MYFSCPKCSVLPLLLFANLLIFGELHTVQAQGANRFSANDNKNKLCEI